MAFSSTSLSRRKALGLGVAAAVAGSGLTLPARRSFAQDTVTITWATWGGAAQAELYTQAIEAFHAAQSAIRVENVNTPDLNAHNQRTLTTAAGGNPSDIVMMPGELIAAYAAQGVFESVESLAASDSSWSVDDYFENPIMAMTWNDQIWGLPKDFNTSALYFNKGAFDDAGLAYPTGDWKWADLLSAAQTLTKRDGTRIERYGWTDSGLSPWPWVWQNGAEVFDRFQEPTQVLLTDPAAVEAMTFYFDLSLKEKVAPSPAELDQAGGRQELFMAERVAMLYDHRGATVPFKQITGFEWDMVEMASQVQRAGNLNFAGYCVSAGSKQKEAAWEFVKWLTGPDGVPIFIGGGNALPALKAAAELPELAVQEPFRKAIDYSRPVIQTAKYTEIAPIIQEELESVVTGSSTAEQAAANLKERLEPIFNS